MNEERRIGSKQLTERHHLSGAIEQSFGKGKQAFGGAPVAFPGVTAGIARLIDAGNVGAAFGVGQVPGGIFKDGSVGGIGNMSPQLHKQERKGGQGK